jgi:hypothetical protein
MCFNIQIFFLFRRIDFFYPRLVKTSICFRVLLLKRILLLIGSLALNTITWFLPSVELIYTLIKNMYLHTEGI